MPPPAHDAPGAPTTSAAPQTSAVPSPSESSTTAPVVSANSPPNDCIGSTFDLDALLSQPPKPRVQSLEALRSPALARCSCSEEAATSLPEFAGPDAIAIDVTIDPPRIKVGKTAKLSVTFKNKTSARRSILFEGCENAPAFSVEAFKGEDRADLVHANFGCGVSVGCKIRRTALTLDPGGTASVHGEYRAKLYRLAEPCEERPIGPLPAGNYTLHVRTLLRFIDPTFFPSPNYRTAEAPFQIEK